MDLHRVVDKDTLRLLDGEKEIMSMEEAVDGNTVSICLHGTLRSDVVLDFQDELCALATLGMHVLLDFSHVTYLSAACQWALVTVQQKMDAMKQGSLRLKSIPAAIYTELEETGVTELLQIQEG